MTFRERIVVRISGNELKFIEKLRTTGKFKYKSDAVRLCIAMAKQILDSKTIHVPVGSLLQKSMEVFNEEKYKKDNSESGVAIISDNTENQHKKEHKVKKDVERNW